MDRLYRPGVLVVISLCFFCLPLQGALFTMEDANSLSMVDATGGAGMYDWRVDGVDHLQDQWFWFRIGSAGPESQISALPLVAAGLTDANFDGSLETLFLKYASAQVRIEVAFHLRGSTPGSATSDIAESISITNLTGAPLDMHFFQYCNLHLNGSVINDSVRIAGGNTSWQTSGPVTVSETAEVPTASHYQAGFAGAILGSLTDGGPTTLSDEPGPFGPGDLAWAFQWDTTIAAGKTYLISKDKYVTPEPASLALLAAGGLAALRRRKR